MLEGGGAPEHSPPGRPWARGFYRIPPGRFPMRGRRRRAGDVAAHGAAAAQATWLRMAPRARPWAAGPPRRAKSPRPDPAAAGRGPEPAGRLAPGAPRHNAACARLRSRLAPPRIRARLRSRLAPPRIRARLRSRLAPPRIRARLRSRRRVPAPRLPRPCGRAPCTGGWARPACSRRGPWRRGRRFRTAGGVRGRPWRRMRRRRAAAAAPHPRPPSGRAGNPPEPLKTMKKGSCH